MSTGSLAGKEEVSAPSASSGAVAAYSASVTLSSRCAEQLKSSGMFSAAAFAAIFRSVSASRSSAAFSASMALAVSASAEADCSRRSAVPKNSKCHHSSVLAFSERGRARCCTSVSGATTRLATNDTVLHFEQAASGK